MEWLGFLGFLSFCIPVLISPLIIAGIVFAVKKSSGNSLKQSADRREIALTGVTSPGVIISAWNTHASGGGKNRGSTTANVTFEIEVQPEGEAPFTATVKDTLPIRSGEWFSIGLRPEQAGKKVWMTYDPNNRTRIIFDHYDSDHEFMVKRRAYEKFDKELQTVRKTGEDATAEILEVEDLNLTNSFEKDFIENKILRLKLRVEPRNSAFYEAETIGSFMKSGLHKYTVGKKVTVKIDRADKYKVALVGAAPAGS